MKLCWQNFKTPAADHLFQVQEEVAKLQVAVDDAVVVEVLDAEQQLLQEVTRLRLSDCFSPLV